MSLHIPDELELLRLERDRLRAELTAKERQLARAEEELHRAIAESHALYLTSLDISGQLDLPSTLLSVLRRAKTLTQADSLLVYLVDDTSGDLTIAAELGIEPSLIGARVPPGEGLIGEALVSERLIFADDLHQWPNSAPYYDSHHFYASAALPMRWQGVIVGVLALHHTQPNLMFSLDELDSLQHVAVQAAIAIYNAKRYAAEIAHNRQLDTLYRAATQVIASLDLDAVLHASLEALRTALHLPLCIIYENRSPAGMRVLAGYNAASDEPFFGLRGTARSPYQPFMPASLERIINAGQWVVLQRNDPLLQPTIAEYMDFRSAQSMLIVPIALGQRAIGMIELCETNALRQFESADIDMALALTAQIGVAIRHAQLHHQLQVQRVNEQAILLNLTRRLLEIHHEQQVAQEAVRAAAAAFNASFVNLLLVSGDTLRSGASSGGNAAHIGRMTWQIDRSSGVGFAALTRETFVVDDILTETRFEIEPMLIEMRLRSALIAPMIYGETVLGVLAVYRTEPSGFSADDANLFSLLAYQTAVALDRAQLFEWVQAQNSILEVRIQDRTREIRAEKERTEAILEAAGESLIVFDQMGRIQQVNRAFELQHGYTSDEVRGQPSEAIFGVDLCSKANFQGELSGIWRGDLQVLRRNGSRYDAAITLSPVVDTNGNMLGTVASLRDISYLKEIDRLKTRFVSNASHELRTPLANMKLYMHLMMNGRADRREHYIATLQREMSRLHDLIEDLLSLSRLETASIEPVLVPLDINQLVGTLTEDRVPLASERGLSMACDLHPEPLVTLADEKLMSQAIGNLLANAMNYNRPGGSILVTTRLEGEDGSQEIVISVADTGLGMSEVDRGRIFERFYRGSAAQISGSVGTGLGMSIVQQIMMQHGGSVTFDSVENEGTTFHLRLPLHTP